MNVRGAGSALCILLVAASLQRAADGVPLFPRDNWTHDEAAEGLPKNVAILNPYYFTMEVLVAWVYAMALFSNHIDVYLNKAAYYEQKVDEVFNMLNLNANCNITAIETLDGDEVVDGHLLLMDYDAILWADWHPAGLFALAFRDKVCKKLLEAGYKGQVMITIQGADTLLPWNIEQGLRQGDPEMEHWRSELAWVLAHPQVHLLTISPHVAHFVETDRLPAYNISKRVQWAFPVFPLMPDLAGTCDQRPCSAMTIPERKGFVIQGNMHPWRRDYAGIFRKALETPGVANDPRFRLHLVGRGAGNLDIPKELVDKVAIHENLAFPDYYRVIGNSTLALATAFSTARYYHAAASSSMAAAFISGIPLCANRTMLEAYKYLSTSAVFYMQDGETDVDCMRTVLAMPDDKKEDVFNNVRLLRDMHIHRNAKHFRRFVEMSQANRNNPSKALV